MDDDKSSRVIIKTRLADDSLCGSPVRPREPCAKPVWQMTGEEFIFLSKHASGQTEMQPQPVTDTERKYVYGILGIAKLFGCSLPTANRIKKSGKIDKAITQIGRKIIVDVELALELAGKKTGGRK